MLQCYYCALGPLFLHGRGRMVDPVKEHNPECWWCVHHVPHHLDPLARPWLGRHWHWPHVGPSAICMGCAYHATGLSHPLIPVIGAGAAAGLALLPGWPPHRPPPGLVHPTLTAAGTGDAESCLADHDSAAIQLHEILTSSSSAASGAVLAREPPGLERHADADDAAGPPPPTPPGRDRRTRRGVRNSVFRGVRTSPSSCTSASAAEAAEEDPVPPQV